MRETMTDTKPDQCRCGETPSLITDHRSTRTLYKVQCDNCERNGPIAMSAEEALTVWSEDASAFEIKRLNDLRRESVLPMKLDDGSCLYATAVSGGADNYIDGMPRQIRLVARDAEGNEVEQRYVQTSERRRG